MKRRQRRPVLELNKSQPSHGEYLQNKCKPSREHHGQNATANPLANLLCHYNSDSDTEESKKDINDKLDDQVNNFLKEIQLIAPKESTANQPTSLWQECLDEATGYPYYWHIETNEVTWEMPTELRNLKNNSKVNSVPKTTTTQDSHWVDYSSMAYQQSHENIPEGMIPREVVARNRNRYMRGESTQKQKTHVEQEAVKTSDALDDDSDDGRIEMITSYGSEESDSDNQSCNEATTVPEPTTMKTSIKSKTTERSLTQVILPQLPSNLQQQEIESEVAGNSKCSEEAEGKHLKSSAKSQRSNNDFVRPNKNSRPVETPEENTKEEPELDFRISLVPGYDEDSEGEEGEEKKFETKCLFPIPQNEAEESLSMRRKSISSPSKNDENPSSDSIENDAASTEKKPEADGSAEKEPTEATKPEEEKSNIFLDTSHGRNKCFQRKRRIAFDVPTKAKLPEESEDKAEIEVQSQDTNCCDAEQDTEQMDSTDQQKEYAECTENTNESAKSCTKETSAQEETHEKAEATPVSKEEQEEVNTLSQFISEKLKFLSEGKPPVSPVQTMAIQLQTLFVACEGGYLEKSYLLRWLTDTGHELERLEQDAAPPGWLCQWDRSHKRYYYQNANTGVTQWTYPDTGIAGGTEEMEICSTPPPPEQDENVASESDGTKKDTNAKKVENSTENGEPPEPRSTDMEAPPPPQISNPSPPPPPRIFAEDLKKDKKRRDKEPETSDCKKKRVEDSAVIAEMNLETSASVQTPVSSQTTVLSSLGNTEPLPPGVDLPEAPYELPATALKRILYNTVQQSNALYDPTTREVPILGHPAAIVQEHYLQYPTYHQHIHAPATLVLPHKHTVQPTIQLIPEYTPIYTNHKVIEKPPVKTQKESLVSALDSFYSDIARIEKTAPEQNQTKDVSAEVTAVTQEADPKSEAEQEQAVENSTKEKKKKKARIGISKKHKEVSSMVAKWQKALQSFEDSA